ncbi:MAG TPA: PQQ-binding-like beta-propeller repeat protein [Pirellulales bacterium]|jgi:outer membrane protein assembly factor BamB|nr:PQQ-binding-like beta-propeller repeat protein [Pirellulales bacterium]
MILRRFLLSVLSAALLVSSVSPARAENWPQWRGARLDGVSDEAGLPAEWSATKNVAWRLPLPGPAGATPVVWDEHIFLTSVDGPDVALIAADTSGNLLWRRVIGSGNKDIRGDEGNFASPSPFTDGQHVWAMMGTGILACYDFAGKEIWKFDLQERYGRFDIQFGMASTPVLDGDHLYLQLIHSGGSVVLCLDKATGGEVWKQRRFTDARDESEQSYASPIIYRAGKQALLLSHGGDYIIAHRLTDGIEVWRCGGLNPKGKYNNTLRFIASPVAAPGLIVVPSAKNGPVLGLRPDGNGDITNSAADHRWTRAQNTPDVPSPLIYDGLVYLCRENGNLTVLDAKTGEPYYEHRTHSDRHRASPVYADGKVYLTARDGTITVVKTGKEFEVLASNAMGENMSASPAIANGTIYLRTFAALYAIRTAQ